MVKSKTADQKKDAAGAVRQESVSTKSRRGALVVVGTGIKTTGQLTIEALAWMRQAQSLVYVVGDPIAQAVITAIKPDAEDLSVYYQESQQRIHAYEAMIEHILRNVRSGKITVGAFYGHPGVFAYPSHESIRRLLAEGYEAKMLPGISAEDCMFADLGIDPAVGGMQTYEATDFLINGPIIDNSTQLVIWQIGTLGDLTYHRNKYDTSAMPLLIERLACFFPRTHLITVYEAPMFPNVEPMIARIPLYSLSEFPITAAMTLYIPPCRLRTPDPDLAQRFYKMY
jgi:uncharacterized protein YabN with tetrapyrrole methylase and pyrophosphatase domain